MLSLDFTEHFMKQVIEQSPFLFNVNQPREVINFVATGLVLPRCPQFFSSLVKSESFRLFPLAPRREPVSSTFCKPWLLGAEPQRLVVRDFHTQQFHLR